MTFLIIIGIFIVILLIFYLGCYINNYIYDKKCLKWESLVKDAIHEFQQLCNPTRVFSLKESKAYKDKHAELFSGFKIYQDSLIREWESIIRSFPKIYYFDIRSSSNDVLSKISKECHKIPFTFFFYYKEIDLLSESNNKSHDLITICNENCDNLYNLLHSKLPVSPNIDQYFSYSDCQSILTQYAKTINALKSAYHRLKYYLASPHISDLWEILNNLETHRLEYNKAIFIPYILNKTKEYFDNLLDYPLDAQQRTAIVTDEDNTLVISSAGSGKTSTIIGKARYLLDKHKIDPKKLLILTYTRKAANELVERLGNEDVDCLTFHSLAVRILGTLENKKPSICEQSLLLNVFRKLINSDKKFLEAVLNYILHLQSLMKLEHEYDKAPDYFADRKKYGIQASYPDMNGNIIFTKSEEEKRICTFLTELGVKFLYEEPYPFPTYTADYRQYKPDFTIFVQDPIVDPETGVISVRERRVYLEHFAVDANGDVPKWFGDKDIVGGWEAQNRKYNEGIVWKRATHAEKHIVLLETKSADFHSGKILDILKQQLAEADVPINPPTTEELYQRLIKRSKKIESSVFKLLEQFIALLKSNCGSIQPFIDKAKEENDERTVAILSNVIKPLLMAYTEELKRRGEMDFTDAIIEATNYCAAGAWLKYDYILVDEFQDISVDRYHFLQFIRSQNPLTKLFCVGDDWQSIYRFAGSNMKLFYKFEDFFGFTEHCKIEKTYRFFNPLLELSSDFIQRNPEQMKKDVQSNGKPMPPVALESILTSTEVVTIDGKPVRFLSEDIPAVHEWLRKYHTSFEFHDCGDSQRRDSMIRFVESIVRTIPEEETILLLGRYNYDARALGYDTDAHDFDRNRERIEVVINGRKIRFMSVHGAKGLEADNVILINCNEGIYGFPSLVEDDPILGYVLSEEDQYEYAEERRLFYVALTRARRHLHILYNGDKPSPFVRELTEVLKSDEKLCPVCQQGHVVVIKHGIASNGNPYTNYGCSNANSGCEYFERVFGDDTPRFIIFNENYKREQEAKRRAEDKAKAAPQPTEEEKSLEELEKSIEAYEEFVKNLDPAVKSIFNKRSFF